MPWFPWQQRAVTTRPSGSLTSPPSPEGGRVTYLSTNNTADEKAFFFADAPEGSKHAARLRQIAMQNHQPDFEPSVTQTTPKKRTLVKPHSRRMITAGGEQTSPPPRVVEARPRPRTTPRVQSTLPQQQQRSFSSSSPLPPLQQTTQLQSRQATIPPAEVYRYEKDGQIAYHKKAPRGELLISAPQGSMEARSMDAAAARLRGG